MYAARGTRVTHTSFLLLVSLFFGLNGGISRSSSLPLAEALPLSTSGEPTAGWAPFNATGLLAFELEARGVEGEL